MLKKSIVYRKFFAIFLFALGYGWIDNFYALQRFQNIGVNVRGNFGPSEYIRQIVFIAQYVIAVAALYFSISLKRPWKTLSITVIWSLVVVELVAHDVYGRPADLANIATLNASLANMSDALRQYKSEMFSAMVKATLLIAPTIVFNWHIKINHAKRYYLASILLLAIIYGVIMVKRGAPALIGFPKGFSYGFGSIAIEVNDLLTKQERISSIQIDRSKFPQFTLDNVVVVIDESIEYKAFARKFHSIPVNVIDFGLSLSGGNCSASSNYIIRKAYWEQGSGDRLRIKQTESLFQIAKQNGYKVTYIDNQGVLKDPTTRNYIDNDELRFIDEVVQNDMDQFVRDELSVSQVKNILATGRNFILINKNGAHFPYEATLDPKDVSQNNEQNYYLSVERNAIKFVTKLAEDVSDNTIMFYTSDHGQNLEARGTHCNTGDDISIKEYTVPFLVIVKNANVRNIILQNHQLLQNRLTHLEFSESIRNVMGVEIPSAASVFDYDLKSFAYCGLYGQPVSFFGASPGCRILRSEDGSFR